MRILLLFVFMLAYGHSIAEPQDNIPLCLKKLEKDARLSSIAGHLALDGQDSSPQMLTDQAKPDEQQKRAIADWIDARSECVNLNPIKILVDLHLLFLSIVPELYNDQMTFGEFNKKWHTLFKEATGTAAPPYEKPATHHH